MWDAEGLTELLISWVPGFEKCQKKRHMVQLCMQCSRNAGLDSGWQCWRNIVSTQVEAHDSAMSKGVYACKCVAI